MHVPITTIIGWIAEMKALVNPTTQDIAAFWDFKVNSWIDNENSGLEALDEVYDATFG
jgi:hypothetical protein